MATKFKCNYCTAAFDKNATLVHTERSPGLWDLDCCMCPDCFKHFKVMLEKAKSQKSWTGWTPLEQENDSLKIELKSLESELQFLRKHDPSCEEFLQSEPQIELLEVTSEGGNKTMKAHRSILISRSAGFKEFLTSEDSKRNQQRRYSQDPIELPGVPTHADSFVAFIRFLYTAELKPEILKDHAPELMQAGNTYKIDILKHKCEDYIVNNMTAENAVNYLEVAQQCNSAAIRAAAVKQIESNPKRFVNRQDYQALKKNNTAALSEAFHYMMQDRASRKEEEEKLQGSDSGSVPASDPSINSGLPRDHRYEARYGSLGMCTCLVHPFAHLEAPGYEYGMRFHAATAMPSTEHFVDPASVPNR